MSSNCDGLNGRKPAVISDCSTTVARLDNASGRLSELRGRLEAQARSTPVVDRLLSPLENTLNQIDRAIDAVKAFRDSTEGITCTHPEGGHID